MSNSLESVLSLRHPSALESGAHCYPLTPVARRLGPGVSTHIVQTRCVVGCCDVRRAALPVHSPPKYSSTRRFNSRRTKREKTWWYRV